MAVKMVDVCVSVMSVFVYHTSYLQDYVNVQVYLDTLATLMEV